MKSMTKKQYEQFIENAMKQTGMTREQIEASIERLFNLMFHR